mmetsp:Transcript_5304/g.8198  ORF Transcript_5304/g.8198 Transcript_5304/m.8198 type:complete len:125 (+) Transcript_5304:1245-1619(+)
MAVTLQSTAGATIVDDGQPGRESIIQNMNSDTSKQASQVAAGYSVRHNLVQKMAPGDHSFHLISWDDGKKFNNMKTYPKRELGEEGYNNLGQIPKILVSGETGDVMLASGTDSQIDQCLGMFFT